MSAPPPFLSLYERDRNIGGGANAQRPLFSRRGEVLTVRIHTCNKWRKHSDGRCDILLRAVKALDPPRRFFANPMDAPPSGALKKKSLRDQICA